MTIENVMFVLNSFLLRTTHLVLCLTSFFPIIMSVFVRPNVFNQGCPSEHNCGTTHWNLLDSPVDTQLETNFFLPPSLLYNQYIPRKELGPKKVLSHGQMLFTGSVLSKTRAGNHRAVTMSSLLQSLCHHTHKIIALPIPPSPHLKIFLLRLQMFLESYKECMGFCSFNFHITLKNYVLVAFLNL